MTPKAPHRMHRHITVSRKPNAGAGCDDVYDEYDLFRLVVKKEELVFSTAARARAADVPKHRNHRHYRHNPRQCSLSALRRRIRCIR